MALFKITSISPWALFIGFLELLNDYRYSATFNQVLKADLFKDFFIPDQWEFCNDLLVAKKIVISLDFTRDGFRCLCVNGSLAMGFTPGRQPYGLNLQ